MRATYIPPAQQPVLIADEAVDVLGNASVTMLVEQAPPAVAELADPIMIDDGAAFVVGIIETEQVIDVVEIAVEPIGPPVDDFVQEDVDFATDIASDITPSAPDTLSFEP